LSQKETTDYNTVSMRGQLLFLFTIFNEWRYLYLNDVCPPGLLQVEQVKAGFKWGKRTPSFNDRRWCVTANEHQIEFNPVYNHFEALEEIAFSKLPRAKETLLAIVAHPTIGNYAFKRSANQHLTRFKMVKPGEKIKCHIMGESMEFPVLKLWQEIVLLPISIIPRFLNMLIKMKNKITDFRQTRRLYKEYSHYLKPATEKKNGR